MKKKSYAVFENITMGMQLAIIMLIFVYGGYKLDMHFDKLPIFLCLGTFVGLGAGLYHLIKSLYASEKSRKKNEEDNTNEEEKFNKWL